MRKHFAYFGAGQCRRTTKAQAERRAKASAETRQRNRIARGVASEAKLEAEIAGCAKNN